MADKIKMRRGELPDLPTLDSGEFGLATDAENLYIGSPTGNILINPVKLDSDAYQVDAYLNPATDNVHGLGTTSKRWRHIVVGPGSLHVVSKPSETGGTGRSYSLGISESGNLVIKESNATVFTITPSGTSASSYNRVLVSDGYASDPAFSFTDDTDTGLYLSASNELSISSGAVKKVTVNGSGLSVSGNIDVSGQIHNTELQNILDGYSSISGINYDDRIGALEASRVDMLESLDGYSTVNNDDRVSALEVSRLDILGSLDGYSTVNYGDRVTALENVKNDILEELDGYSTLITSEGADGYIAFFTGSNSMAGDNDLFYNRATGDVTIGSGGNLSVGGKIIVSDGSASAPSITFANNSDTGLYLTNTQIMRIVVDGATRINFNTGGTTSLVNTTLLDLAGSRLDSSTSVVNLGTSASTNHGLSTNDILIGSDLEVDGYTYLDSGVAVAGNAGVSGDLTVSSDLSVDGYSYLSGFSSDGNAGVTGNFDITGDIESAGDLAVTGTIFANDGSATFPSISFSNKPFTGLYITQPAGFLGISVAATTQALFAASEVQLNNWYDIMLSNGFIYDSSRALTLGTELTTSHDLSSGDVIVGGDLEIDGYAYFDSGLGVEGNVGVTGDFDIDGDLAVDGLTVNDGYITSGTGTMQLGDTVGIDRNPTLYKLEVQGHAGKTDGGTSWATISDITEKKDISKLSNSLDRLTKLSGVLYRWINPEDHGTTEAENILRAGFIAQEVCEYFPEWVKEDINGKKWLDMIGFEAYVVESIKQIKDQFDKYDKRLSDIEEIINGD